MKNFIGQVLGALIVLFTVALAAYTTGAVIEWCRDPALWAPEARRFVTFLFWGLLAGFIFYRTKP